MTKWVWWFCIVPFLLFGTIMVYCYFVEGIDDPIFYLMCSFGGIAYPIYNFISRDE